MISKTTNAQTMIFSVSDSDNIFLVYFYVRFGHISSRHRRCPIQVCTLRRGKVEKYYAGNTREYELFKRAQCGGRSVETIPKALHRFVISVSGRNFMLRTHRVHATRAHK